MEVDVKGHIYCPNFPIRSLLRKQYAYLTSMIPLVACIPGSYMQMGNTCILWGYWHDTSYIETNTHVCQNTWPSILDCYWAKILHKHNKNLSCYMDAYLNIPLSYSILHYLFAHQTLLSYLDFCPTSDLLVYCNACTELSFQLYTSSFLSTMCAA